VTNGELQRIRTALVMLGNRRMANLGADLKVARLLRVLAPLVEPLEDVKRKVALALIDALPEGTELTGTQEQIMAMRIASAQTAVDNEEIEVELPMQFALRETDLPKEGAGKEGGANCTALGAIVADLGPLYLMDEG
jgi:hypothetical protein